MRILGVDYGKKRTGLAIADTEAPVAVPLKTVESESREKTAEAVAAAAMEESVGTVVVGLPSSMGGGTGNEWQGEVREFVAELKSRLVVPVETEDERLTTAMVGSAARQLGASSKDYDKDAAAAAAILEGWLARRNLSDGATR
jgi:putative Holliday junction resolvase